MYNTTHNNEGQGENVLMPQNSNVQPQNNLGLQIKDGKVVVSSRDVAARFDKRHYNVLRDIENLECSKDFNQLNFEGVEYLDSKGEKRPEVLMTRDGFTFLAMGFTGAKAARFKEAYIAEFNRMEAELAQRVNPEQLLNNPDFMIRVLTEIKSEREKIKSLEVKVAADKPKVLFADAVQASQSSVLIGELAKILRQNGVEIGAKRLFTRLREDGYLGKCGENYNMPTQRAMELGLFEIKKGAYINSSGCNVVTRTPKVTGKGQVYFANKYLRQEVATA